MAVLPTAVTVIYTVILGIFCSGCISLFVAGYVIGPYWDSKQPQASQRVLFCCSLSYTLGSLFVLIGLIIFLVNDGDWTSVRIIYFLFIFLYVLSWFTMLYVWIQRLETTFAHSAYEYSKIFMKRLKGLFWAIVAFALITLVLFILNGGGSGEGPVRLGVLVGIGLFVISFISLILVLFYSFVSKLNRLRKIAEDRLNAITNAGDYDFDSLVAVQKLVSLQFKLTILALTAIISTLIAMVMVVPLNEEAEFMVMGTDCIIGFICMHCTIKKNNNLYEKICKLCIISCNCCFKTSEIEAQTNQHIQIHSQTLASNTGSGSGNTVGPSTTSAVTNTSAIAPTDQATPRPSQQVSGTMPTLPVMTHNNSTNNSVQSNEITIDTATETVQSNTES